MKNQYLNCTERYEDIIDRRSYTHSLGSCETKTGKKSGVNGIQTHNLCDTVAMLYQLSYQANWELVKLLVHYIPTDGGKYNWYIKDHRCEL